MKKIRKISLEELDLLSKNEASKIYGGQVGTTPPVITVNIPPPPPVSVGIKPPSVGITVKF